MDNLFNVKYSKMLSFSLVAEALPGLIYHRPPGENSSFLLRKNQIGTNTRTVRSITVLENVVAID